MDKTGIIVVSLCVVLLGWWFIEQKKMADEQQRYAAAHPVATAQSAVSNSTATATAPAVVASAPVMVFDTNMEEQTLVFTNKLQLAGVLITNRYTFTSRGGGLKLVELLNYPQTISARWKGQITNSAASSHASLNARANVPVLAVLGDEKFVGDGNFTLTPTAGGVRAEKTFADGLRLGKNFSFSSHYLLNASVRIENTSDKPLTLAAQELVVGTATPMDADDSGQVEGAMWSDGTTAVDQPLMAFSGGGCSRAAPKTEIRAGTGNVVWAAAHNQFFALVAMPKEPAQEMVARTVTLPRFQNVGVTTNGISPQGIQTALIYPAQTLTANSAVERQIILFAGPKEYRTLARIGEDLKNNVDQVMNFGSGFGSFWGVGTFFAKLLLSAMNWLHDVTTVGYGWTIVLITVIIKLISRPARSGGALGQRFDRANQNHVRAARPRLRLFHLRNAPLHECRDGTRGPCVRCFAARHRTRSEERRVGKE